MVTARSIGYVLLCNRTNKIRQPRFLNLCKIITIISILLYQSVVAAAEIVAVQSLDINPYNDALEGFEIACNCDVRRFVVSEMGGVDIVKKVHEAEPDIIIAIGNDALNRVKGIKDIPIVYVMILNPQSVISNEDNITGISMNVTPEKQLAILQRVLPDVKRIGLLYNPDKTGYFVKKAKHAAPTIGIELIAKKIRDSKDVPALLKSMKGKINAFWLLPDITVVTPETVEFLLLFSIENKIPVIAFSDKYVEMGALMSLDIDANDIGRQAWEEIVKKILSGTEINKIARTDARKIGVTINQKAAKKLGITIGDEFLNKTREIIGDEKWQPFSYLRR